MAPVCKCKMVHFLPPVTYTTRGQALYLQVYNYWIQQCQCNFLWLCNVPAGASCVAYQCATGATLMSVLCAHRCLPPRVQDGRPAQGAEVGLGQGGGQGMGAAG